MIVADIEIQGMRLKTQVNEVIYHVNARFTRRISFTEQTANDSAESKQSYRLLG
jgi:hypothetical protein